MFHQTPSWVAGLRGTGEGKGADREGRQRTWEGAWEKSRAAAEGRGGKSGNDIVPLAVI